jgi:ArsR family transcriptional regulator
MQKCAYAPLIGAEAMQDLIKAMKALSDETRLRIMNILLERECCVCEVMEVLGISQTRASRNLGLLEEAGFLKMRKIGQWALYSLDRQGMKGHLSDLVNAVQKGLADNEVAVQDRRNLKQAARRGPVCTDDCCQPEIAPSALAGLKKGVVSA